MNAAPEYKMGDKAICKMCDHEIVFIGPYWDHVGEWKPRHPGLPKTGDTIVAIGQHPMTNWESRARELEHELKMAKNSMAFCVNLAGGRVVIPDSFVVENYGKLVLRVTRDIEHQATIFTVDKIGSNA